MKSKRVIALFVLLVVGLLLVDVGSVWALGLTPTSPIAGQSFIVSGVVGAGNVQLTVYSGSGCNSANTVYSASIHTISGAYSFTVPGQPAGPYSVLVLGDVSGCFPFTIIPAATSTTTSAPPIPEYPLGLPILAILTIIGYGFVRRRTQK